MRLPASLCFLLRTLVRTTISSPVKGRGCLLVLLGNDAGNRNYSEDHGLSKLCVETFVLMSNSGGDKGTITGEHTFLPTLQYLVLQPQAFGLVAPREAVVHHLGRIGTDGGIYLGIVV